ncbi:MAG: hypothetical protein AAGD43_35380 [Pseudomonadota bacterium]
MFSSDFEAALTGRYGFLVTDRDLVFATAGLALLEGEQDWRFGTDTDTISIDTTGLTFGIGWERALGRGHLRVTASVTQYDESDSYTSTLFPGFEYVDEPESFDIRVGYSIPLLK